MGFSREIRINTEQSLIKDDYTIGSFSLGSLQKSFENPRKIEIPLSSL